MNRFFKKALAVVISAVMAFTALPLAGIDFSDFSAWAAQYITGDVVTLGSYPQSRVTDSDLLAELNSYNLSWDNAVTLSGNGSIGSMSEDGSMRFFDVEHNGKMYRAVNFSSYRPELTYRTATEKNSYQDDNGYKTNTVYWFEYEPLKWRIIDAEQGIAISENLIDSQAFANKVYKISDDYYSNQSGTTAANSYADSSIGYWLNGTFMNVAFTEAEKEQITMSKLGDGDFDKIFLPSYDEISSLSDEELVASGTDYAKAMGLYTVEGNSFWWLRDAGSYSYTASRVSNKGIADVSGNSVDFTSFGVRPAIRLDGEIGGAYTVTFDFGNGKTETTWYAYGETIKLPEAPVTEGYEFAGWIDSVTGEAMPETMPAENVTLVPNWKPADGVAYTVETYMMTTDGSGYEKSEAVKYGTTDETITIEAEAKEGFTFDAEQSVVTAVIKADGSTVLTLYYNRNKNIVNINGVEGEYYFGSEIVLTPPEAPEGYAFSHWENQNGETVVSPLKVTADEIVVTPVFSALSFEVTFVVDGEVYDTGNYEYATEIVAPSAPSKTGYSFEGWSDDGINVLDNLGTVPAHGVTFTAVFSANSYSVKYYVQNVYTGVISEVKTSEAEYGSAVDAQLDYTAPFGYSLSEAYKDSGFVNLLEEGATVPEGGINLYFKFIPNVYEAVFYADGGEFSDGTYEKVVLTPYETEIIAPEAPSREGYDFDGWDPVVTTMDEEYKEFYATWTPAVYTVTYYQMGEVYEEFEMCYGDEFDIPADPYINGYEFLGWAEVEDSEELAELPEYMPSHDLVYYAVFYKTGYSTYWVVDGKTTELVFESGQEIELPSEPTRIGYTFAGWDPQVPEFMPEEEITFTARWTVNSEDNLIFKTDILKQNPSTNEWETADTVAPGETVKARIFVDTSYFTNAGNIMVFYDKNFFEDSYKEGTSRPFTSNTDAIGNDEIYINGNFAKLPSNNVILNNMVGLNYLTSDFVNNHQAYTIIYTFNPSDSIKFNGEYWFAEFTLKVREDATGSGDFLVAEGSIQNVSERPDAYVNVPLNKENGTASDSTALYNIDMNAVTIGKRVFLEETLEISAVSAHYANYAAQVANNAIALSDAETELEYTWVYFENKTYTPTVYLTYDDEPFDAYKELNVSYYNNNKVGNATVTLQGINRFTGNKQLGFIISNEQFPAKVQSLNATASFNKVNLSWTSSASKFNIYRKIKGGEYVLLATTSTKSYADTLVQAGVTYYYQVSAVGAFEVEGEKSDEVSVTAVADTQAPSDITMNSSSGSVLSGTATFTASATDNDRPAKAVYSYSTDGGATWIPIGEATDDNFTATLDTTVIDATEIKVKVIFEDEAGNKSVPYIADYTVSNAPAFTMEIRQPSITTIKYGDAIYLHADITGTLPAGAKVKWIASNGNFTMEVSEDTLSCKISPKSKGTTTFTAVVVDENDNQIAPEDTQDMTSKAGFFQKIFAFFRKLFGLTKTYPQKLF